MLDRNETAELLAAVAAEAALESIRLKAEAASLVALLALATLDKTAGRLVDGKTMLGRLFS